MIARVFARIRHLSRGLFRRAARERDLDREMRHHLDLLIEENLAAGMRPEEARLAALREFGGVDQYREACRDSWRPAWVAAAQRDLRFAATSLRRTPGFTLVALVTIALGVGANTSMFSLVNAMMLKPLPYPGCESVDLIHRATAQDRSGPVAAADYLDAAREAARGYGELAAYAYGDVSLAAPGEPAEFAASIRVSSNFFRVLGIAPQAGRDFADGETLPGHDQVVVLSRRCWRNRFGSDPGVVGRTTRIDGVPHTIVGVMPESFNDWRHLGWVDVFRPLALTDAEAADRANPHLSLIGRRDTSRPRAEAAAFIAALGERLAADFPALNAGSTWRAVPVDDVKMGETGHIAAGMLIGLSGFVLLIACSNLANLLLARTMARAREFAVRAAIGASRLQLLRPLILESLLLALCGGGCAVLVARWTTDWLTVRSTGDNGEQVVFALDGRVLGWAFLASLVTAVAFGIAPALFALRLDAQQTLKSGGRGATAGRGHLRLRHLLIVGQLALTLVLLAGAALLIRGIDELNNRRDGWESDDLVTGTIRLPPASYPDPERIAAFHRLAIERLAALPGADSVALSHNLPFLPWYDSRKYIIEGREPPAPGREPAALVNGVSPDYFATVGTRLLAGRVFSDRDTADATPVAIVSESMARTLFGDETPIGRRIAPLTDGSPEWIEIVGVAADARSVFPDAQPVTFQVYRPLAQESQARVEIAVRTSGVPASSLVADVRATLAQLDPDLPVRDLKPANDRIARANYQVAVLRDVLSMLALLGLGLASIGIYGVISRLLALRTTEFGIRIALGAQVRDVTWLVLASGVRLALMGSMLGLIGAFGVSRLLLATFPRMPIDTAPSLGLSTLLLTAVALLACYLPARQAARLDPTEALRAD